MGRGERASRRQRQRGSEAGGEAWRGAASGRTPRADESLASLYSCRFAFLKEGPPKIRPPESEPALRRH